MNIATKTAKRLAACVYPVVGAVLLAVPTQAEAHLGLDSPTSRYGPQVLKNGPCGRTNGARSQNVTTYRSGETITVRWNEYVDHPGNYRIAFDADGDDDFEDPACLAGCDGRNPTVDFYNNGSVLLDNIPDNSGGNYSVTVTLPNIECTNCTLQVIQVMYDKPPYTIPGNEMYYQCADLILAGPPADAGLGDAGLPPDAGVNDAGPPLDTGTRADAGSEDVGVPADTGAIADAGGVTDAGSDLADSGVAQDAGGDPDPTGCFCVDVGSAPTSLVLLIVGLGLFWRRRHRL